MATKSTNKTILTLGVVAIFGFLAYKLWPAFAKRLKGSSGTSNGTGTVSGAGYYAPYYPYATSNPNRNDNLPAVSANMSFGSTNPGSKTGYIPGTGALTRDTSVADIAGGKINSEGGTVPIASLDQSAVSSALASGSQALSDSDLGAYMAQNSTSPDETLFGINGNLTTAAGSQALADEDLGEYMAQNSTNSDLNMFGINGNLSTAAGSQANIDSDMETFNSLNSTNPAENSTLSWLKSLLDDSSSSDEQNAGYGDSLIPLQSLEELSYAQDYSAVNDGTNLGNSAGEQYGGYDNTTSLDNGASGDDGDDGDDGGSGDYDANSSGEDG